MLQTLLNLLNLYLKPDTDRASLVQTIESDTTVFKAYLQAASPATLSGWHEAISTEQLRELSLALANQAATGPLGINSDGSLDRDALVATSRSLMSALDPEMVRDTELVARLAGSMVTLQEAHLSQALRYFQCPLETLPGTHLVTRVLAVALELNDSSPDLPGCASLLTVDPFILEGLTGKPERVEVPSDVETRFSETLANANLYASTLRLAATMDRLDCLREVSTALFSSDRISVYTQRNAGWHNGHLQFDVPQSLVVTAANAGRPVTTAAHTMTVMDDEALQELGTSEGIALPVLLDDGEPDSCVAVVLLGMNTSSLMTLSSRPKLLDVFNSIASGLFQVTPSRDIDLEDVENRAREIIHEANNPLSTVQNYLKVLSLKLGPEHDAQPTIESISSELMRAADIIRSFRDIPESAGKGQGVCDINKSIRTVASLFDEGNDHIRFNYQLNRQALAHIRTDDFKQIVTNLIKNAVEELSPGDSITLRTESNLVSQGNHWVEVTIIDSGPGIQTGAGDIFERGIRTKAGAHAGEGLAVVKHLTERSGGFVSYRTSSEGSEFRITLKQASS